MSWEDEYQDLVRQVEEIQAAIAAAQPQPLPDMVVPPSTEFVLSADYLNKAVLFPRQGTLLKTLFLELDGLTAYDFQVLGEWQRGFYPAPFDDLLQGRWFEPTPDRELAEGTTPDLLERMELMRERGRRSFRHFNMVAGRRAGKGELAAMAVTYLLWQLLALGEPQPHVNAARGKVLTVDCFAGNREQARATVFADIVRAIINSPCFAPFLAKLTRDRLVLATPFDRTTGRGPTYGTIEIIARETTILAGRGQTSVCQIYDEMAWVDAATSKSPADELYAAATPALDQARGWGLILTLSSPYQRMGQFYALHRQACEVDTFTGEALFPEMVTFQLPSWAPYLDHEAASTIPMSTTQAASTSDWLRADDGGSRTYPPTGGPPIVDDEELRQKEKADPVRFLVETCAQWANTTNPFLMDRWVKAIFTPLEGHDLEMQHNGILSHDYVLHLDPSSNNDPTAYMIGHAEVIAGEPRVIVDRDHRYVPIDGEDLDWEIIYADLEDDIRRFQPGLVTVDQHGGVFVLNELQKRVNGMRLRNHISLEKFHHTRSMNLTIAGRFREAAMRGLVRSYPNRQLQLELQFLQDDNGTAKAPTTGPVTTDDEAICLMVITHHLLGGDEGIHQALGALRPSGHPGLVPDPTHEALRNVTRASNRRRSQPHNPARAKALDAGHRWSNLVRARTRSETTENRSL